mmetsp:Transcript_909/g.1500  ORF Transcript_909/g.1500 Transcript_909/m.1500 type:complete len:895 (+) Transcript_909:151-2835(+)|eukprot:CAMPEP_0185031690 /NCGR_PEP_ID=MMETSP1103-20130426/19298_1 /TAXON_ID=36769 /ORGANISM="Paraphysomonas bandaiensis, Strain Caron Lab Isolate" /LENGTH=894 /DNA_ID=CAMNT_0027567303 /DNA_START=75 /DNA_END=2759 /DNA_ORIENTATION=+
MGNTLKSSKKKSGKDPISTETTQEDRRDVGDSLESSDSRVIDETRHETAPTKKKTVLGLRRAFRRMKRAGLGDSEIHNNIRKTYTEIRESPEGKASLEKTDSIRNIALKNLSHTLETNRNKDKALNVDDTTTSTDSSRQTPRNNKDNLPIGMLRPDSFRKLSHLSIADDIHSNGKPPTPPSQRRRRSRPNLKVEVSEDMVSDANLRSLPMDGCSQANTPREDAHLSPGGGLHIGNFAIKEAGIILSSTAGHKETPHAFLTDGKSDFVQIGTLGSGASGSVLEALHLPTLTIVALKMIPINDSENLHNISSELGVLYHNLAELQLISSSLGDEEIECEVGEEQIDSFASTTPRSVYIDSSSRYTPRGDSDTSGVENGVFHHDETLSDAASDAFSDIDGDAMSDVSRSEFSKTRKLHRRDSRVLSSCQQLLAMYDAFLDSKNGMVNLVVEYMDGGSLQDVVENGGCQDEDVLADIAYQVLLGLDFLHSRSLAHRDVKPGNILLNCEGIVKLADFGISKVVDSSPRNEQISSNSFVGTMCYMAPERIRNEQYGFPGDIWSVGMTILAVLRGCMPLSSGDGEEPRGYWNLMKSICDEDIPLPGDAYTEEFNMFIRACLEKNPASRPTVKDLLQHSFLRNNVQRCCYSVDDDCSTSSNVFADAISALESLDVDDGEESDLSPSSHPKLVTTRSLPTRSATFQGTLNGSYNGESISPKGDGNSGLSRLTARTATQRSNSLGRVAWTSSVANTAAKVAASALYPVEDIDFSDVSTVSDTSVVSEEDVNITAVRLEHLEGVLSLTQQKYCHILQQSTVTCFPPSDSDSSTIGLDSPTGVYKAVRSGKSLSPSLARASMPKLPNFKSGMKHWRHLAQQLHLPVGVVESAARNIVDASFFQSDS